MRTYVDSILSDLSNTIVVSLRHLGIHRTDKIAARASPRSVNTA